MIKLPHGNHDLLRQAFRQDLDDLLNKAVANLDWFLPQVCQWLHLVNVQVSMSTSIELIINLEEPSVHI